MPAFRGHFWCFCVQRDLRQVDAPRVAREEEARPDIKFAEDGSFINVSTSILPTVHLHLIIIYVDPDIQLLTCAPCCTISKQQRSTFPPSLTIVIYENEIEAVGGGPRRSVASRARGLLESDAAASWIPQYQRTRESIDLGTSALESTRTSVAISR